MLQRSRRTLQKAMHLNPLDYSLQFNMYVFAGKERLSGWAVAMS